MAIKHVLKSVSLFVGVLMLVGAGPVSTSTTVFTHDKTKDGWQLVENISEPVQINMHDLKLVSYIYFGEKYVKGDELRRRARVQDANLSQQHAEYILEHQEYIPEEFQDIYFIFPGTVWQNKVNKKVMPCLFATRGRWQMLFCELDYKHSYSGFLISTKK